jgi:hypothetical protein
VAGARYDIISILGKRVTRVTPHSVDAIARARAFRVRSLANPNQPSGKPSTGYRKIPRSIYEEARDVARALAKTEAFKQSGRDRKRVEMLFAHLKRILRLGRLRLRRTSAGLPSWSPGHHRSPLCALRKRCKRQ